MEMTFYGIARYTQNLINTQFRGLNRRLLACLKLSGRKLSLIRLCTQVEFQGDCMIGQSEGLNVW